MGFQKARIAEILKVDPVPFLEDLSNRELVYTAPGKELSWWRPTPEALLALGLRSYSDISELKELERYFDSVNSFGNDKERQANLEPILEKAKDQPGKEVPAAAQAPPVQCAPRPGTRFARVRMKKRS